jgi:hypothetical protein
VFDLTAGRAVARPLELAAVQRLLLLRNGEYDLAGYNFKDRLTRDVAISCDPGATPSP